MSSLFGQDFQERVDRQHRQVCHQQLADAQSFRHEPHTYDDDIPVGAKATYSRDSSESDGALALIPLGFAVLLVLVSYGVKGTVVSAAAALPAAIMLMMATRGFSGDWDLGFGRAFTTAFMGIFLYLAVTAVIGFCVNFFHEPVAHPGFGNRLAGAIVEFQQLTAAVLSSLNAGEISISKLFGLVSQHAYSGPLLVAAFAALHGPGLLICAIALTSRIEYPYQDGIRGLMVAWAVSLAVVPSTLVVMFWIAMFL